MQQQRFFGTATLAKWMRTSPVTVERALRRGGITPDAWHVTPSGRKLALFSASRMRNLKVLLKK